MNVTKRKRKNETDICWSLSFCLRILGTYSRYGYSWLQGNDIVTLQLVQIGANISVIDESAFDYDNEKLYIEYNGAKVKVAELRVKSFCERLKDSTNNA